MHGIKAHCYNTIEVLLPFSEVAAGGGDECIESHIIYPGRFDQDVAECCGIPRGSGVIVVDDFESPKAAAIERQAAVMEFWEGTVEFNFIARRVVGRYELAVDADVAPCDSRVEFNRDR
jgi:hypothetical protein